MTPPPGSAPASMAGCGLCAVMAAVALSGWNPARRLDRAWAARPHSSCASGHSEGKGTHPRGKGAQARTGTRHNTRKRCPKVHHHVAGSHTQPHPAGPSAPAGTPGGSASPTSPTGPVAPAEAPASGETSTPPPSLPEVQVSATEYHYTLSRTTVPAGRVIIQFVDNGQDEHNLNAQGSSGPPVATFATVTPKTVTRQTLELKPGSYTLFCSLSGHEAKGMKATLTVE